MPQSEPPMPYINRQQSKYFNIALLLLGFFVGQGGLFAAQTYLLFVGNINLFTLFSIYISFVILAQLFIDFGGIYTLSHVTARHYALDRTTIGRYFWSLFFIRLVVFFISTCVLFVFTQHDQFGRTFVIFISPGLLVWTLNASGILDGVHESGKGGLLTSLPYLLAAMALFLSPNYPEGATPTVLGSVLSVGYMLAVIGQHLIIARRGIRLRYSSPSRSRTQQCATEGAANLLTLLPGQLYYRAQIILANSFLDPSTVAAFLYSKQIITASGQILSFVRRVEFPHLVTALSQDTATSLPRPSVGANILSIQRVGTYIAAILTFATVTYAAVLPSFVPVHGAEIAIGILWFSPCIVLGALSSAMVQGLQAQAKARQAAAATVGATTLALMVNTLCVAYPNLAIFAISDALVYIVVMGILAANNRRTLK